MYISRYATVRTSSKSALLFLRSVPESLAIVDDMRTFGLMHGERHTYFTFLREVLKMRYWNAIITVYVCVETVEACVLKCFFFLLLLDKALRPMTGSWQLHPKRLWIKSGSWDSLGRDEWSMERCGLKT